VSPKFLLIETSSRLCSVAISNGDDIIWSESEIEVTGFCHAEKLHMLIDRAIKDSFGNKPSSIKKIDAIGLAGGPGSYTGLRIGASAAKGLALPLNIPLIAYSSLAALAHAGKDSVPQDQKIGGFWAAMDAKRLEVYSSMFDENIYRLSADEPFLLDEQPIPKNWSKYSDIWASGDGVEKAMKYWPGLKDTEIRYAEARHGLPLSLSAWQSKNFVSLVNWVPNYLKVYKPGKANLGLPEMGLK